MLHIFYCNWMKQSLLFILTASILVSIAVGKAEIQGTDDATNLNSAKSNIYRDISGAGMVMTVELLSSNQIPIRKMLEKIIVTKTQNVQYLLSYNTG